MTQIALKGTAGAAGPAAAEITLVLRAEPAAKPGRRWSSLRLGRDLSRPGSDAPGRTLRASPVQGRNPFCRVGLKSGQSSEYKITVHLPPGSRAAPLRKLSDNRNRQTRCHTGKCRMLRNPLIRFGRGSIGQSRSKRLIPAFPRLPPGPRACSCRAAVVTGSPLQRPRAVPHPRPLRRGRTRPLRPHSSRPAPAPPTGTGWGRTRSGCCGYLPHPRPRAG